MIKPLQHLKDWWWLATLVVGATVFVATLPKRLNTIEAGQAVQKEKVSDLEVWAARTQGYVDGQQQMVKQQQQLNERLANQDAPPLRVWSERDGDGAFWTCEAQDYEGCWSLDLWRRE